MGFIKDFTALFPLMAGLGRKNKASRVYDLLADKNILGEKSLYLNLGYWEGGESYDQACENLARVLAEAADLRPGQRLLDCGYGFGDQDLYWAEAFKPARIVGLNITESQVRRARQRVAERGLSDRVELLRGSATAMPVPDASFDRVTALETAFHYDTREDFFREAFRALKPGGRIATADILPLGGGPKGLKHVVGWHLARSFWQIPAENIYSADEYAEKLEHAGFRKVTARSIREKVYPPLLKFVRAKLAQPEYRKRFSPLILAGFKRTADDKTAWDQIDYLIFTGEKP